MENKQGEEFLKVLEDMQPFAAGLMRDMEKAQDKDEVQDRIVAVASLMQGIIKLTPPQIYAKYQEFFESFMSVCENCRNEQFLAEQYEEIYSSLNLFAECLVEIGKEYQSKIKTCACCGNRGMYLPLPQYYDKWKKNMALHIALKTKRSIVRNIFALNVTAATGIV